MSIREEANHNYMFAWSEKPPSNYIQPEYCPTANNNNTTTLQIPPKSKIPKYKAIKVNNETTTTTTDSLSYSADN